MLLRFASIGAVDKSAVVIDPENGIPGTPGAVNVVGPGVELKLGLIPSVETSPLVICNSGAATRFCAIELDDRFYVVVNP